MKWSESVGFQQWATRDLVIDEPVDEVQGLREIYQSFFKRNLWNLPQFEKEKETKKRKKIQRQAI